MNEKNILSLLVGPGLFSNKELKEVASRALNTKFLQEFDELNIKIPDAKENEPMADDGDASPISIDDEEERRMQEENERMSKKVTGLFSKPNATKNLFQKSQYESTDYENFEDEEENQSTEQISNQLPFMIPKAKDIKPNPYEKMTTSQLLTVLGTEKNGEIYRLSDMYLPTTKEHRGNVFKYLYKNMMRNPKDALRMSKNRHEGIKVFEKQILTMFGRLYEHKFVTKQEAPVAKAPEANVFLLKDAATNPTSYSNNPVFSPLNSAEWFEGLERDLLKGITTETKMEVEKEVHDMHEDLDGNKQNGETEANHIWKPQNGPIASNHAFGGENKLIPMEPSSRRVAHGTPSGHTAAGIKEKERTDKYNFQKVLSSLFESTPTRDNDNQEPSVRSEEDQSVANPFGGDSPGNDNESTGFHKVYNRSVNQNMREYLNDHYDRDRKALFSFYTGLRGHDKEETALWGEISKEVANGYEGMNGMSHNAAQERINYNYVVLPFKNEKERSIFKYETDIQDASEMEMSLLQKKRKLDKNSEIKIKVGVSIESMYYNKNVLEASWNDFFFKAKVNIRKEREYGQIVIDLNDKSVFYDRIHPIVFGVQKATRKAIQAMEEVPDQAAMFDGQQFEDNKDAPRIDTSDLQPGGVPLRPSVSKDYLGVGGTQHVPSESGSMSIGNRKSNITKQQKLKLKAMRVEAVKSGLNIEHLTKEDARNLLLGRTGKSESKVDNVALPNILRVINDLKKKISTQSIIQHSKVAEEFQFNEFHIKKEEFEHFHRPDMRRLMNDQAYQPWRIEIVKQEEEKKDQSFVPEDPFGVNELVHSFEHFKNHRRLSLKEGKFALFEYIEENPLILSNVGMASRINRYVYSQRAYAKVQQQQAAKGAQVTENQELMEFVKMIKETLGPNGSISFLDESKNIPLIGQLTKDNFVGVTVLDNNLFYAPIFIHKAPETDFVLVRYTSSDGTQKCYLRKIEYIYTVGQIEPKVEVFNPSCRGLTSFIRKSTKHIIKKKFKDKEIVYLEEMKQLFPTVNDHNMKKAIQRYGGDPDPDDNKRFFYNKDLDNELNDEDADRSEGNITPEEVCQYERMHASNVRLKNVGLEDLRSCDKINTVRKRYMTRNNLKIWNETILHPDKRNYTKMNIVANYVSEELQLTAWNLSQSFLSSKQKQGRLCLTGFGDPTSGHGGYSYVKLPLKTSRYEKEDKKSNANKLNQVTGTEADLRKLPIKLVDKMILTYGNYKEDHISKLTRWDKIDLLRQIANEHPDEKELKKYTRQFRLTTKMQKEKYQKDINTLFMKLVDNLSRPGRDDIPSDNEGDFDCGIEQLIDKELEDIMKKAPKDLKQAEAQALDDDDDKGDDGDGDVDGSYAGDGGDDGSDIFQD